eukprot:CAMPEP_0201588012 /NCGR_PEP_ID=MMETSP0190_2-20130828/150504_1 /ASSEMBLY_ACC=CAM_ASM_000263 /TAXON_ID=37353 /ORGANISM="Rosalina sp." /LENGTH=161 /DNA_ID=CAMNT_0048039339 /DNA_START=10 /DNA_END=492 /DNA_ORIENTATION=-
MADPNEIDIDMGDNDMEENANGKENVDSFRKPETNQNDNIHKKKKPKIQFRNYIPKDQNLRKKYCVKPASFIEIKDEFTELIEKAKILNHDIHDITPKKANWDLKRDCQQQLDQLKYLTQIAIRKLVEDKKANMSEDDSDDEDSSEDSDDDEDDSSDDGSD